MGDWSLHQLLSSRISLLLLLQLLPFAAAFQFPQQRDSVSPWLPALQSAAHASSINKGRWLHTLNFAAASGRTRQPAAHQALAAQPTELLMPQVSSGEGGSHASTGFISSWHAQEGQHVKRGDPLFVVESDKADVDVEAPHKGILRKILVREGVRVNAGSVVGLLDQEAAGDQTAANAESDQTAAASNSGQLPPGAVSLFMPALSSTMTQGTITKWHKQEGDKVGEKILVVESDKADMEVEAFDAGYLAGIRAPNGSSAAVGETIAYIVRKKEHVDQLRQALEQHVATGGAPVAGGGPPAGESSHQEAVAAKTPAQAAPAALAAEDAASEQAAQDAAAEWIIPPVDQTSAEQQLPGASLQQLQQLLRQRLSAIAPEAAKALADEKTSEELLRRMQLRLPPRATLLAKSARFASEDEGADRSSERRVILTPAAEAFAAKHNVPVKSVRGTGFGGRITLADVKRHLGMPAESTKTLYSANEVKAPAAERRQEAQPSVVELTSLEKAIAKNMEATLDVPVFRLTRGVSVDRLFDLMTQMKTGDFANATAISGEESAVVPGLSVLLAKAVGLTLKKHPLLNARFDGTTQQIINPPSVDIAMAVSIKGGLVTPVLKDVLNRDVFTLARSWRHQVAAAQAHDFAAAGLTGGTFYISNLGMSAIDQFDALLPQNVGCIMAVGSVRKALMPAADSPNGLTHRRQMNLTLTCDHRHIYGQHAADFLTDLAALIEKAPNALLVA
ncbi:hypothetical protein Efla_000658 [Eimeria flavescens]